jgi:hypothetical protein
MSYREITHVKCTSKKPLVHGDGTASFLPQGVYEVHSYSAKIREELMLINEQGEVHELGNWYKHFKYVKS